MRFRVLGPVEAENDSGLVALGPARQQTVLAVLLVEVGMPVPLDQLAERVWGPAPPETARQTLYSYLSRLRGVLAAAGGPPLVRRPHGCALEVAEPAVDIHRFRELAREAQQVTDDERAATLWNEALDLWRGDPFANLDNDWLRRVGEGWEQEHLAAVLDRNDALLRRGEHGCLILELSAVAARNPFDERVAGQLMQALYQSGRQADALAHYRAIHKRLHDELASEPGPALRALHQRILRQEEPVATRPVAVAGTSQVVAQLPTDVTGFAGRVAALRQLDSFLGTGEQPPDPVVITAIGGCAGVGKTALALHWAHRVADRFPDGQIYLNLRGFDPAREAMSPGEAVRTLLDLLLVPAEQIPVSVEAQSALYRSRLAGSRILVVLDNARDAEQVRPLLPGTPGSLALVTSRDQLAGLVAEVGARPLSLDVLGGDEARLLLTRRLGAERVDAEPAAVDEILRACAGLPLALAIVAARAATHPTFPLASFAAELADHKGRLDALAGTDPATDLRAVFSWSYRALAPPAARMFRLFGLHPAPEIDVPATASLAGLPVPRARRLLGELTAAHLLTEYTPGRWTCHDLVRAYARELAGTEPVAEQVAAIGRLLDHYVHTAAGAARLINSYVKPITLAAPRDGVVLAELSTPGQATDWFAVERSVLLDVVEYAAGAGHDRHAWQLAWALRDCFDRRGWWHELLTIQQAALGAAERLADQEMRALAHRNLGVTYRHLGGFGAAEDHLLEALALFEATGDKRGQAMCHAGLSFEFDRQGRYLDGLRHSQRCVELFRDLGDPIGEAVGLGNTGWFHAQLGDYRQTIVTCQQAAATLQQHGHADGEASARDTLGLAHHRLGDHAAAIACFQEAVVVYRRIGNRYNEASTLTRLGDVQSDRGDRESATGSWHGALELLHEIGHPDADDVRKRLAT